MTFLKSQQSLVGITFPHDGRQYEIINVSKPDPLTGSFRVDIEPTYTSKGSRNNE